MTMSTTRQLSIYYDGLCPICTKEIELYRRHPKAERIRFVDIADPGFIPEQEGLKGEDIHKRFHAKKKSGEIIEGVDAFVEIWRTLDMWRPLQWAATHPALRPLFNLGYKAFAAVRPAFRRQACDSDYCETKSLMKETP